MKSVLFIAYYFPPVAATGGMRPLGFCRYLEGYGWRPSVITTTPECVYPPHPVDPQLITKLPSTVTLDRVAYVNVLHRAIATRDRFRAMTRKGFERKHDVPSEKGRASDGMKPTGKDLRPGLKDLMLDWAFCFPDPQSAWLGRVVSDAKRRTRERIPQLVFATGGPWTSLLVGKRLAEYWRVPLVADYRDPWTSNPYVTCESTWLNKKARRLEESVLAAAARVITNTAELRNHLQERYPAVAHKMLTITNGFDPDSFTQMYPGTGRTGETPVSLTKPSLELCHFGTVYGKRSPVTLLQALLDLYKSGDLINRQLSLRFVGVWEASNQECEETAQELEKRGALKREPPIAYAACLQQMCETDALLIIQPDSPLQIPGKIYEYVATGRPLILIGGEGATANLVEQHHLGLVCSNDREAIRRLLLEVVKKDRALTPPTPGEVERFNYRSLTGDLAKVFDEVHREHSV